MYHKTLLDNGLKIVTEKIDAMRSVSLGIWVNAGSRDEIENNNGISHFIEHMIFKGTLSRSSLQIAKELDAIGGLSNAFTGKENTCFHGKVLDKHFPLLADILSDILLNSLFAQDDVERERQVILQEISMMEDTPEDNIHVLFQRLFWPGQQLGMPVLGTVETVKSIDRNMISNYVEEYYTPERILVVAAGGVDHETVASFFEPAFQGLNGGRIISKRSTPGANSAISCHFKDLEQVHICLGGEAPSLTSEKRFAAALLNTILGGSMSSRLFQEVREKMGLAYSVYSFLSAYVDVGLLGVYVATDVQKVNTVLECLQQEIKKICLGQLSEAELIAAKEHLIGGIYLAAESTDNRMLRTAKNEIMFGRYISHEELASCIESVTLDAVIATASNVFKKNGVSLTTVGPIEEQSIDLSCLHFS
jgi:predicted Zn-dependent peptidase